MRNSGFFRVLAAIVVAILLVGIGVGIYQAGVTAGAAGTAAGTGATAAVPYAYGFHGWGFGFGFFGILWFLFVIFLLAGLVRFAFGFGRRGGPRGYGHGWSDPTWMDERNRRIADLHRRLHEEQDAGRGPSAGGTSPGGNG